MRLNLGFSRGVTREVFLIGRWALKFPSVRSWRMFCWGLLSNMQEVTWGRGYSDKLCPVLGWLPGGWLVVMRRVDHVCLDEAEVPYDEFEGLPCNDHKACNFGWLDGRVVAVDYGSLT